MLLLFNASNSSVLFLTHPTVRVTVFGSNGSECLSSSREELPVDNRCNGFRTRVHCNVGRGERTDVFEVTNRMRY